MPLRASISADSTRNGSTNITDATAGAEDVYVNFGIADAGSTATDALTVNGTITVTYYLSGI